MKKSAGVRYSEYIYSSGSPSIPKIQNCSWPTTHLIEIYILNLSHSLSSIHSLVSTPGEETKDRFTFFRHTNKMCILGYAAVKKMKERKSRNSNTRVVDHSPRLASSSSKVPRALARVKPESGVQNGGGYGDYTHRT
jgi:hypothetical protein